jgi:manganese/zinc/iron transport system substrate-binding protein
MHRLIFQTFSILILLAALIGCGASTDNQKESRSSSAGEPYRVVTTTGMITDITRRIAGERASVTGLMSSGVDPHLYQPTRSDMKKLIGADIVFYSGLHLEGKMIDAFDRIAKRTTVHAVTETLDRDTLFSPPAFDGHYDPHVWMDPLAWRQAAAAIHDALVEHDPAGQAIYDTNAEEVYAQIDALHAYAERALGSIPEHQRVLVTAHDAFSYFGRRYGLRVVGIQGISTESEAGVRDVERLVDLLVSREISAVFVETTVSQRNIKALIAGAQSRGHTVIIGGALFSDAMGPEGSYEGTYIGMIDHNVTLIARALGGDAPARGLNGQLSESTP